MKNETARREIESLDYYLQNHTDDYSEESHTAMMMAIKALDQEPCDDAISRQAVLDIVNNPLNIRLDEIIKKLPPVTPQPKTGHWIDIMVGDMPAQACDRCNTFYPLAYTGGGHNYCPNCGAKMIEPQERSDKG